MLEHIISTFKAIDKYGVRLMVDEPLSKYAHELVQHISDSGTPRDAQTAYLCLATAMAAGAGALAVFPYSLLEHELNIYIVQLPIMGLIALDIRSYLSDITRKPNLESHNGAIAADPDVPAYDNLYSILRPYAFLGCVGSLAFGAITHNPGLALLGCVNLPWVMSFYTRDDSPNGGLWEKVAEGVGDIVGMRKPELQRSDAT